MMFRIRSRTIAAEASTLGLTSERIVLYSVGGVGARLPRPLTFARRSYTLESKTKGAPQMKHLDIYARRDPQLAPYLLREVDIEWKRKCRKVNFVYWIAILTMLLCLDDRITLEVLHYLKLYVDQSNLEQEKRDEDHSIRRQTLIQLMDTVKTAYMRDQQWKPEDAKAVTAILNGEKIKEN